MFLPDSINEMSGKEVLSDVQRQVLFHEVMGKIHHITIGDYADKTILFIDDRYGAEAVPCKFLRSLFEITIRLKG